MGDEGLSSALQDLVRKDNLHPHQADQLLCRSLNGEHTFILGPHQAGKIKLAQALADDVGKSARVWFVENVSSREVILNGLKCAKVAGADYVLLIGILPADLFWLLAFDPSVCVIASLSAANPAAFWLSSGESQLDFKQGLLQKSIYQVGFDISGHARLINELSQTKMAVKPLMTERLSVSGFAFPQNWAKDTAEHDPGWELDSEEQGSDIKLSAGREEKIYE